MGIGAGIGGYGTFLCPYPYPFPWFLVLRRDPSLLPYTLDSILQQNFFEERQRPRVIRLSEPKQCTLAHLAVLAVASEINEGVHALVGFLLRQREHGRLFDLGVFVGGHGLQAFRGAFAGDLADPEHGGLAHFGRQAAIPRGGK